MLGQQANAFLERIEQQLPYSKDLDEAVQRVKKNLEDIIGDFSHELEAALLEAKEYFIAERKPIEILQKRSILEPHIQWYLANKPTDKQWPALKNFIAESKGWGHETANNIGESADEVVSLLANPKQNTFQYRGLVVGYVQSGKTANMTAVIAKAIDAGYNFVLILAGLTNKLRQQTQRRMESDLIARHPGTWFRWTNSEDNGDFRKPQGGQFAPHHGLVQLSVLKKNVSPLKQFLKTVENTPPTVLNDFRVLILDDECDSASVNAASREFDITAINDLIRRIISRIPAVSYVGYTATPFANVLINPYAVNNQIEDLYPRNFITTLDKPIGYFGTEELFGSEPKDADDIQPGEEGLNMIRNIPYDELEDLRTPTRSEKDTFYPKVTMSLQDALLYFIGSCAARYARDQQNEHMTMLVHTSVYAILHDRMSTAIETWLNKYKRQLINKDGQLYERLRELWEEELEMLPDGITSDRKIGFDEMSGYLSDVLSKIDTPVENADSDNRLDYNSDEAKIYIVVGGTVLARGLTLEGLMVSYFLRTTSQYDTLLQMGRWFGFRQGYEDLPRIWMTDELKISFRRLATVETEIRHEIRAYSQRKVSPMDFAVRIRSFPGMAITAASKMRHAITCNISFSGQHRQTIRFSHKDTSLLQDNWNAAAELLTYAKDHGETYQIDKVLFNDVPTNLIRRFFQKYKVHSDHKELSAELLIDYITKMEDVFENWNVGLFQPGNGECADRSLGPVDSPRLVNRAAIDDKNPDSADIKALMSTRDIIFDCVQPLPTNIEQSWAKLKEERQKQLGAVPLLLLYVINKESRAKSTSKNRVDLDAEEHILGFGIVFPKTNSSDGDYISVDLDEPSADEIESLDEEIDEQMGLGHEV